MTTDQKIDKIIIVLDKVEKFVTSKMPAGTALLSPELKAIRTYIKELKN